MKDLFELEHREGCEYEDSVTHIEELSCVCATLVNTDALNEHLALMIVLREYFIVAEAEND